MVSGKKRITAASRGFSLLEVIIVLGLMGIVLVTIATFARKALDDRKRRAHADAIAEDVYGVLKFINADTILASVNDTKNNIQGTRKVTNPLYQQANDPIYEGLALTGLDNNPLRMNRAARPLKKQYGIQIEYPIAHKLDPYIGRTYSQGINYPITIGKDVTGVGADAASHFYSVPLNWSQARWKLNSDREYFTDGSCGGNNTIHFNQQFISCEENSALAGSEIALESIHLVNRTGTTDRPGTNSNVSIDRVDVYIGFIPNIKGKPGHIQQYIAPLMAAFRTKKITPNVDEIYLVRNSSPNMAISHKWQLLNKNGQPVTGAPVVPADLAKFSDLPNIIGRLDVNGHYGIRFSFDGKGDYLRNDGLNSATKVCWNTAEGRAGPCIEAPSTELLTVKQRENPHEFANLQVKDIILKGRFSDADGAGGIQTEYYTASHAEYHSFKNAGHGGLGILAKYRGALCSYEAMKVDDMSRCRTISVSDLMAINNGAIHLPVQSCPVAMDENNTPIPLHPRISTAVSSAVSVLFQENENKDPNKPFSGGRVINWDTGIGGPRFIFNNAGSTISSLNERTREFQHFDGTRDLNGITINRLGGAYTQVNMDPLGQWWTIAGVLNIEENNASGKAWVYYNPPGLSIQVTTWCSSIEQPDLILMP